MKKPQNIIKGVIHVHSIYSDGTGDIKEIVKSAKKADISYVIITDHNSLEVEEGIYDKITVIKGEEISKENKNHYLSLNADSNIISKDTKDFIEEVRRKGGYGIICHPFESTKRKNPNPPIRWENEEIIPDGVEIWNWFSNFADNFNSKNILTNAKGYFFKDSLIKTPMRKTLNFWDKLNLKTDKIIPAVGGIDAHCLKVKKYLLEFKIFPYPTMFRRLNNVLYLEKPLGDDFEENKKEILSAIKDGRNLIINRKVSNKIPEIKVINKDREVYCGGKINLDKNTVLKVKTNINNSIINIIKDGCLIYNSKDKNLDFKIEEIGKYRVEIKKGKFGFAYSNPIIVENE